MINHIQNKKICLHNICICTMNIYYVYINTHTCSIYFENVYMYLHVYIYIIYKCISYKHTIFLKYIHACVWIYNKCTQYAHIV